MSVVCAGIMAVPPLAGIHQAPVLVLAPAVLTTIKHPFEKLCKIPMKERFNNLQQTQMEQLGRIEAVEKFLAYNIGEDGYLEKLNGQFIDTLTSVNNLRDIAKEMPNITSSKSKPPSTSGL